MMYRVALGTLALVGGAAVASSQGGEPSLRVCVGADQVLRSQGAGECPSGSTPYALSLGGGPKPPQGEEEASAQQVAELRTKVDMLSSRLLEVQKELAGAAKAQGAGKVKAPFEVVDDAGKTIFRVKQKPRGFELVAASGQSVGWGAALDEGGFFKTRSSASFPEVVMGSSGKFGGLAIRDAELRSRASLTLTGGKSSLELTNEQHAGIVSIMQGSTGGGFLQLGNATGTAMVQAGTTSGHCGKVETYPHRPPAAVVGVPGSWIMGKGC